MNRNSFSAGIYARGQVIPDKKFSSKAVASGKALTRLTVSARRSKSQRKTGKEEKVNRALRRNLERQQGYDNACVPVQVMRRRTGRSCRNLIVVTENRHFLLVFSALFPLKQSSTGVTVSWIWG